jgi:hypothetical protein
VVPGETLIQPGRRFGDSFRDNFRVADHPGVIAPVRLGLSMPPIHCLNRDALLDPLAQEKNASLKVRHYT